jgi:3-hydroxy acid dehydrogenase/malonic semialdehyde reductase
VGSAQNLSAKATPVAVITGASSGIGLACAQSFARAGYALLLGARRVEKLAAAVPELLDLGASQVLHSALDVCDGASVEAFCALAERSFKRIDVLVNNAGLAAGVDPVAKGKDADWAAMLETNVHGLLRVTRGFLGMMIPSNHGHIFNMGSIASFQTYASGGVYAGTKHAVRAISGALRLELSGTAIRVTEIDPGMVETEFSLVRLGTEAKAKDVYKGMQPLTAADIAECIYFAASRPAHVNIDHLIIMPTQQASVYKVHREPT